MADFTPEGCREVRMSTSKNIGWFDMELPRPGFVSLKEALKEGKNKWPAA